VCAAAVGLSVCKGSNTPSNLPISSIGSSAAAPASGLPRPEAMSDTMTATTSGLLPPAAAAAAAAFEAACCCRLACCAPDVPSQSLTTAALALPLLVAPASAVVRSAAVPEGLLPPATRACADGPRVAAAAAGAWCTACVCLCTAGVLLSMLPLPRCCTALLLRGSTSNTACPGAPTSCCRCWIKNGVAAPLPNDCVPICRTWQLLPAGPGTAATAQFSVVLLLLLVALPVPLLLPGRLLPVGPPADCCRTAARTPAPLLLLMPAAAVLVLGCPLRAAAAIWSAEHCQSLLLTLGLLCTVKCEVQQGDRAAQRGRAVAGHRAGLSVQVQDSPVA
jgi:hypothetical protein